MDVNKEIEFTRLVEKYKQMIYKICYFFSKDSEEVKDMYQEVLVNLWMGFGGFRGESNLNT